MSEESKQDDAPETSARGGWPKGRPRKLETDGKVEAPPVMKASPKIKAKPNWDESTWDNVGIEPASKLHIPKEIVDAIARDGYALQWCTRSVRGKDEPLIHAQFTRGGWTPVHQTDFDGILNGMFMSKDIDEPIVMDDCILMLRPLKLHQKALEGMRRDAGSPVKTTEAQIGHGVPGVTGGDHVTALRGNAIRKTIVQIPD